MTRRITKLIFGSIILIGLTGCNNISNIDSTIMDNCNNKPELLVSQTDKNIYTYCVSDSNITINNKTVELKEYILNNDDAIDKIIDTLEYQDSLSDGGTKIFKSDNITLIKCNTIDGNKDIYIGNEEMKFKQNFCKDDNYTFIRTYTIKRIEEYDKQQYEDGIPVSYSNSFKVELSQFEGKTETVIINNLGDITLEKNKTYEFEFMLLDDATNIQDSIEYIFKNSQIIEVRETSKVGVDQLQEEVR